MNSLEKMEIAKDIVKDCYNVVRTKGGNLTQEQDMVHLNDAIESIPTGGGVVLGMIRNGLFSGITNYDDVGSELIVYINSFSFDSLASNSKSIKKIDLHNAIINNVNSWWMINMLYNCQALEELDLRFVSIPMPTYDYSGGWLYNSAPDWQRIFSKLVYLGKEAEPWAECTNKEKEKWEKGHPQPEDEISE